MIINIKYMGDLFYFIGLLVFIVSVAMSMSYHESSLVKEWAVAFKRVSKKDPVKSNFKSEREFNSYTLSNSGYKMEVMFFILGMLTSSWPIYFTLLTLQIFVSMLNKYSIFNKTFGFLFQITKSITIILLVMNHFHFHKNIYDLIITF